MAYVKHCIHVLHAFNFLAKYCCLFFFFFEKKKCKSTYISFAVTSLLVSPRFKSSSYSLLLRSLLEYALDYDSHNDRLFWSPCKGRACWLRSASLPNANKPTNNLSHFPRRHRASLSYHFGKVLNLHEHMSLCSLNITIYTRDVLWKCLAVAYFINNQVECDIW